MFNYTDQTGRQIVLTKLPEKIISLVPSQTELLFDLELDKEVIGITKFCVHPYKWYHSKKRIGGTKNVNIEEVASLQPDLIIANKEENTQAQVEELAALFPTWVSNIQTIDDGLQMIRDVGALVGKSERAQLLTTDITNGFNNLKKAAVPQRVAYFIWRNPWMCAGGDTFINNMIEHMGWTNVLSGKMRYPEIALQELADKQVNKILLSSEPYPFKDAHIAEIKAVLPDAEVLLVDGEMFSWYGSRMLEATAYLRKLI